MRIQKLASTMIIFLMILNPFQNIYADDTGSGGVFDDSVRDMATVLGAGAAGAVLGLSTLSFVDEPSKHLKNIAIGGALGIVIGVTVVVFSQASKTSITEIQHPINQFNFESIAKDNFKTQKIAENYLQLPNFSYQLEF
jgi:hypothetical protein